MGQYLNRLEADLRRRFMGECRIAVLQYREEQGCDRETAEKQLHHFRNSLKYQSGRRGVEYGTRAATGIDPRTGQHYHWVVVKSVLSDYRMQMLWPYGPMAIGTVVMDEMQALHMAHRMAAICGEESVPEVVSADADGCLFRNGHRCCGRFDCLECEYGFLTVCQRADGLQEEAPRDDRPCRDNPNLCCGGVGCERCGWNPEVEQRRKRRIREKWG